MKDSDLIRMANQIAKNFSPYPQEEAVEKTRAHLRSFWDPRMRRQICQYVENGGANLNPVAKAAVDLLRQAEPAAS